jgi:putative serine protease PepD
MTDLADGTVVATNKKYDRARTTTAAPNSEIRISNRHRGSAIGWPRSGVALAAAALFLAGCTSSNGTAVSTPSLPGLSRAASSLSSTPDASAVPSLSSAPGSSTSSPELTESGQSPTDTADTAGTAAGTGTAPTGITGATSTAGTAGTAGTVGTAGTAGTVGAGSASSSDVSGLDALQAEYVSIIKQVLPSVVLIRTPDGLGSGVVFDSRGDIVTNNHVVGTATAFQVTLANSSKSYPATLVGAYPAEDLAVIRVQGATALRPAVFADSSKAEVGDVVLAMGNPLGLASSVTDGIISALGRPLTEPAEDGQAGAILPDCIQTSAAINPGNSGGALVNLQGQVVGIPTLTATDPQLGGTAPGIGFAISSTRAKLIATQLVSTGKVTNSHRAALGVSVSTVADAQGQPAGAGIVAVTAGGAAAKAGLRAGDVITAINGSAVTDAQSLTIALTDLQPGQTVPITVVRADGSTARVNVTLGTLS